MKNKYTLRLLTTVAGLVSGLANLYSQTDSTNSLEGMSLKDLLNIKIVSVSKTSETLFEAPLSASVVTKEDIQRAGCTSIMEALRLVPGMIVREQTNGNYEVQLRGAYTTPDAFFDGSTGTTLVMVNNRPIFNYLKGSTFWESIPVDLNDVEKIEVVRGPAGALYGPNAVNGVINIITRQAANDGLYAVANSSQGSYHTNINNASLGYRGDKWSIMASGNYQHRERTQTSYYEFWRNAWLDNAPYLVSELGDTMQNAKLLVPYPVMSVEKYAGNFFANYNPSEKVSFNLSSGLQHSLVQKVYAENGYGPLTTSISNSRYVDLRATAGRFSGQVSFIDGTQVADHQPGNKYDFNTFDASIEYNYSKGNFSLKPGLSYRSAVYDDTKYSDMINKLGIFNAKGKITTQSASLRSEYKLLNKKLRLVAGVATNTFNYPDKTYLSYEFATTYKLNKKHLVRAVYSRTPRSASVYDAYVDQSVPGLIPIGLQKYVQLRLEGNKNIQLFTVDMLEAGYRGHIAEGLSLDVEVFNMRSKNYSSNVLHAPRVNIQGADTILTIPIMPTNLPAVGNQTGITAALTYTFKKWQIKPYVTLQQSNLQHFAPYTTMPDAPPTFVQMNPQQNNIYSGMGSETDMKNTPAVFGGMTVNYAVDPKLNVNLNAYYMSQQTIYHSTWFLFNDGVRGVDNIKGKCIVNANISYKLMDRLQINANFKNVLNNTNREFFKTDEVPFMFLGGIHFQL